MWRWSSRQAAIFVVEVVVMVALALLVLAR
jgi:hypothetical protein